MKALTERDYETLNELDVSEEQCLYTGGWLRPMDVGAWNGSYHSWVLAKLVKRGLAESKKRGGFSRGSKLYRITAAGRELLQQHHGQQKEEKQCSEEIKSSSSS